MTWEEYPVAANGPTEPRPTWWSVIAAGGLIVVVLIAVVIGAGMLGDRLRSSLDDRGADIEPGLAVTIEVSAGASAEVIGGLLADAGVVSSGREFETRVQQRQLAGALQAGTFALETGMDTDAVIDVLVVGAVSEIRVTVVEGLTVSQTLESLSAATGMATADLEGVLLDGSVTSPLLPGEATELRDWEGLLFPDTYSVLDDAPADTILQLMADTMVSRVDSVDWSRLDELGLTQYEAIVLASLIEEEVRIPEERPVVASVIYNRLAAGSLLQIDATVQYALPERKPVLSFEDLEVDSPYNTYQNLGLPPTPIAGVGLAALEAAADPASTEFFYYVLTSTDGTHSFTETEAEFLVLKEQARADGVIGQ